MSLSQSLYELAGLSYRPTQMQALRAIESAYMEAVSGASPRYVLCEAPTGTGKSYIVLLLALAGWLENGHKSVVSTHTHVLQGQIVNKDFLFLRRKISQIRGFEKVADWKAKIIKGRSGFPCLRKIFELKQLVESAGDLIVRSTSGEFMLVPRQQIMSLAHQIQGGAGSLSLSENDRLMDLVSGSQEECTAPDCPFYRKECLYYRNIRQSAPLLVVNHALLMGLMDGKEQIEEEDIGSETSKKLGILNGNMYFFDEAHHLLGYRTMGNVLEAVDFRTIKRLIQSPIPIADRGIHKKIAALSDMLYGWWVDVCERSSRNRGSEYRLLLEKGISLYKRWTALGKSLKGKNGQVFVERCSDFYVLLRKLHGMYKRALMQEGDIVVEGQQKLLLSSAEERSMKEDLRQRCSNLSVGVFLSGTMTIDSSFDTFCVETGIEGNDVYTIKVNSPFNYENVSVWVPRAVPAPNKDEKFYAEYVSAFCQTYIPKYIDRQLGGVLVLCSSLRRMRLVADALTGVLPSGKVFVQGNMPKHQLAKAFLFTPSSVLVGSASFREGFDAPKDKLTWVIIDRLPFSPVDSQMKVRTQRLKRWGAISNPFKHSMSLMKLFLVQSVGRLIRTEHDRGLITVLDPRMWNDQWGLESCVPRTKEEWLSRLPSSDEWEQMLDHITQTHNYTLLNVDAVSLPVEV